MISGALSEAAALDILEPRWAKQGYRVIRQPSLDQIPLFLKGLRPDAIAVGPKPSLVIEVIQARGSAADTKVRQLQSLFANESEWRLEVVYTSPSGALLEQIDKQDILAAFGNARHLADTEPRAGLLLAWAGLEAIVRRLEPDLASRSLPPRSLVEVLISTGRMPQSEGQTLRRLGDARNAVAHGQLDLTPASADIRHLVELGENLAAA